MDRLPAAAAEAHAAAARHLELGDYAEAAREYEQVLRTCESEGAPPDTKALVMRASRKARAMADSEGAAVDVHGGREGAGAKEGGAHEAAGAPAPQPTKARSAPAPKSAKDWDAIAVSLDDSDEEDDKLKGDAALNKLFRDIYARADDDTRRAMNKSFVESNGTTLSTNWGEIGAKETECRPPEGMVAKKYGE